MSLCHSNRTRGTCHVSRWPMFTLFEMPQWAHDVAFSQADNMSTRSLNVVEDFLKIVSQICLLQLLILISICNVRCSHSEKQL